MNSNAEVLSGLTRVINEFFDHKTSNDKKHAIEQQLITFSNQSESWKICLFCLTNSNNQYVQVYCLQVVERLVNIKWIGTDPSTKQEIRKTLSEVLAYKQHHQNMEQFVMTKLIKVIIDIGRCDWPMFYVSFFDELILLTKKEDTRSLGLIALKMTSEEFISSSETVSTDRRKELKILLLEKVPQILQILTEILNHEWKCCFGSDNRNQNHVSIVTPPPSPGSNTNLFGLLKSADPLLGELQVNLMDIGDGSFKVIKNTIKCLTQYFTWIQIDQNVSTEMLNSIFKYARLSFISSNQKTDQISVEALKCVNELTSRNCFPALMQDALVKVFRNTFFLIQQSVSSQDTFDRLDNDYVKHMQIFLRLFVVHHFSRMQSNNTFPLTNFLHLLTNFTFIQTDHEEFRQCLEIWEILLEYINDKVNDCNRKFVSNSLLERYQEGFSLFYSQILQHIQFTHNHQNLCSLDFELIDDNGYTEWEDYLIKNIELIASISKLFPTEIINNVNNILNNSASMFLNCNHYNFNASQAPQYVYSFRDLASILQCIGRISPVFIHENFHERWNITNELVQKLLHLAVHCTRNIQTTNSLNGDIKVSIIEIHAQVLAALQPFTHWMAQLYSEIQEKGNSQAHLSSLLSSCLDSIVPVLINKSIHSKVLRSAIQTFSSVVTVIRPTFLSQLPQIIHLFKCVAERSCNYHSVQNQAIIYKTISNLLVLPWPNTPESEQKYEERSLAHYNFISSILVEYNQLSTSSDGFQYKEQAIPLIHRAVIILTEISTSLTNELSKSRDICYASLRSHVDFSLGLIDSYVNHSDTSQLLMKFYLQVFRTFRRQIGVEQVTKTIEKFMTIFNSTVLQHQLNSNNGEKVVQLFLELLSLVIDETGTAFKILTSDIIQLVVENVFPLIVKKPSADISTSLFEFLHKLLSRKHRYFFPSPVLVTLLKQNSTNSLTISHKQQFLKIMQVFGNSFLQEDVTIYKQSISILQDLNCKLKIYEKIHGSLFEENVLFEFVFCFIKVLIAKTHDILTDDLCSVVHQMCLVDFNYFHQVLLQQFLHNLPELTQDQKKTLYKNFKGDQDSPTFTSNLMRFVTDLRYYQLCNSSLQPGTVQF